MANRTLRQRVRWLVFSIFILTFVFGGGLLVYGQSLEGRIVPGVVVGNVALGGLTASEAQQELTQAVLAYENSPITVILDSQKIHPRSKDLGIRFDVSRSLGQAYSIGRNHPMGDFLTLPSLDKDRSLVLVSEVDMTQLAEFLHDLKNTFEQLPQEPRLSIEQGTVRIIPAKTGKRLVIPADLQTQIQFVADQLKPPEFHFATEPTMPKLRESDFHEVQKQAQQLLGHDLTVTFQQRIFTVDSHQLEQWLAASGASSKDIQLGLVEQQTERFFDQINEELGVPAKTTFGFRDGVNGEYAYKNSEGQEVDRHKTAQNILAALRSTPPFTAEVVMRSVEPPITLLTPQPPQATGKSIVVDLDRQLLQAYDNGQLVFWTRVSTGRAGYHTPTGQWRVYNKTAKQVMDGPGYYLPNVKWVLAYNGDYTIHGTYWHTNFGEPMSHGCTNVSEADAQWLYNWAEVDTPVVIRS